MNAEILSIGTELLLGEIVDTNSAHIARTLRDIGVNVYYMATVGDNMERIKENILMSLSRSDVVITTGGLGPTVDDVTRQAAADAVGRDLVFHQELLDQIAERFARFGAHMSENNRLQAYIPDGARIIKNPVGTAPCYIIEDDMGIIISLPGVPTEMKHILKAEIMPYLREKMGGGQIIKARILKTAGIGESHLDEQISDLMTESNPTVGLAAHTGQTDIRITARADSGPAVDEMLDEMEARVRERVGSYIYATGQVPLQNALVEMLRKHHWTVAISETDTNGRLHQRIKTVPGAPEVLKKAVYHNDIDDLRAALDATSEASVDDLVDAEINRLLEESGADLVIAVATHETGTAIVARTPERTSTRTYNFGGRHTEATTWAGTWGMSLGWRLLRERLDELKSSEANAS